MSESSHRIQIRLTPIRLILLAVGVIGLFWLVTQIAPIELPALMSPGIDTSWSKPVQISSGGRYGSGFSLHSWNEIPVGLKQGGTFYFLNKDNKWIEKTIPGFESEKNESCYPVAVDAHGPKAIFCDITYTNNTKAVQSFVDVTITPDGNLRMGPKVPLPDYSKEWFKDVPIAPGAKRVINFGCLEGTVVGTDFYIPYFASSEDGTERITSTGTHQQSWQQGPSESGFLYSSNGVSWQKTRLDGFEGFGKLKATDETGYLLTRQLDNLWFSTRSSDVSDWSKPKLLMNALKGGCLQVEADEVLHLCWLDGRLKKGLGFFLYGDWDVGRKNNLVFYCNYQGGKWGREKRLSGNLTYCGSPSMSVEGERIVVVWENFTKPYTRASTYYTVSKNNGRTWSRIYKVENFEGTADSDPSPKVLLYHDIIHLFYDRGGWPASGSDLMYQWRKFPD
jgi:hypothetical protein